VSAGKHQAPADNAIEIDGARYYAAEDLCRDVGIARGTLWRWRTEGKVPAGRRYRGQRLLFTEDEAMKIRRYAQRLEPAPPSAKPDHRVPKRRQRR